MLKHVSKLVAVVVITEHSKKDGHVKEVTYYNIYRRGNTKLGKIYPPLSSERRIL